MKKFRNTAAYLLDEEAKRFGSYLNPPRKPKKMLRLFELLRRHGGKQLSKEEKRNLKFKIYGKGIGGKQFDMLIHRLRVKVFDFLLSEITHNKHPVLEKLHAAQINVKNKYALYYFLNYTGRSGSIADDFLNEAIASAKEYDCYGDLLQLLHSKGMKSGYRLGEKEIDKALKEIEHIEKCARAVRRASELYYRTLIRKKFNANPDLSSLQKFLKESIKELQAHYKQTRSPEVLYFLKLLEIDFFQNEKNLTMAKDKCIELLKLVAHTPSVFTNQRLDYGYANLAQCHAYLGDYDEALDFIRLQQYIIPYTLDWLESKELEFRILFYKKKFTEARRLLDAMQKSLPDDIEPIRKARIKFYLACVLFIQGNLKKAQEILHINSELLKDKSGWAVSIRMLELMMLAEQNKKREITIAAKCLDKFIRYNIKSHIVSTRDELMADLLSLPINFENKRMKKRMANIRKRLSVKKGDYAWDPFGHEIIRYDEWLGEFINNTNREFY